MRTKAIAEIAAIALVAMTFSGHFVSTLSAEERQDADPIGSKQEIEFFNQQIHPILKSRCYQCHSHESGKAKGGLVLDSRRGWEKGGSEGTAIVPGKPDESLLIQAVRHENYEMPPDEKLPEREIKLLTKWVSMGAPDPRKSKTPAIDPKKLWALQPISKPTVPITKNQRWPRDELDSFILVGLEEQGLEPTGDADRYTLLRRVTFDLTGLPPTPDEIHAFINDRSDRAYEKVVDRLLNSPGFGDHWARHWFDLSCYADLADIQGNVLIRDAWRYRDYVIESLNTDKPLDYFFLQQIAGDLLPWKSQQQRRENLIATGYLAIGPWTLQNYIKGQLAADVVDHQIDRIGRSFLGQTISCARCHDHKFDPIPTADYYALAGIFHSTLTTSYDGPGVWSAINEVELPDLYESAEKQELRKNKLNQLRAKRQPLQSELNASLLQIPNSTTANILTLTDAIDVNRKGTHYELRFQAGPSVWSGASQKTMAGDGLRIDLIRKDGTVLTTFRHTPEPWSGKRDAQRLKPVQFSYLGDGTGLVRIRITCSNPGSGRFGGAIDDIAIANAEKTLFSEDFNRIKLGSIQGSQANTRLNVYAGVVVPSWAGAGINHSHIVELGNQNFAVQFFGGNLTSLAQLKPDLNTEQQKTAYAKALEIQKDLDDTNRKISELEKQNSKERALAVVDTRQPSDSPIYRRGDFQNLGEIVPRGFLSAVSVTKRRAIPDNTSGRLQLAEWLTDPENPLTSRVMVNRIWHHIFGQGLVRTVDYFGVHGETPSHPELLDFLAERLRTEDQWSLKKTVRRMVLSRTYQMASAFHARANELDPDNRLLWQMPRRRLTAESIRDAMLSVSGNLDSGRGGPSLGLELPGNIAGLGGKINPPTWRGKVADHVKNRRTVYLPFRRERPVGELEILSTFDFPHPNDITGARPNTTVATQALFLLNAPFVKQQAAKLAERLAADVADEEQTRINRLYHLAISRPASAEEIETSLAFLERCTQDLNGDRNAAWTQLCHAVLGSNNFLFRE